MIIQLSQEQIVTEHQFHNWLKDHTRPTFTLGGYAGTGKTFLMANLIQQLGGEYCSREIICAAPTGKAASVLREKLGGFPVRTIHSILYAPIEHKSEGFEKLMEQLIADPNNAELQIRVDHEKRQLAGKGLGFNIKEDSGILPGQLVMVDEASMVTQEMYHDLVNTGAKVMFVGDPGQLPPVGDGGWFLKAVYDAVLEKVQRQALESPIIRLSMQIRKGQLAAHEFQFDDCRIVNKSEVSKEDWLGTDQVITGMNATRRRINNYYRRQLGHAEFGEMPRTGEKLICLKNEKIGIIEEGGTQYINGVQAVAAGNWDYDDRGDLRGDVLYEGQLRENVLAYDYHFLVHQRGSLVIDPWQYRKDLREFDYAYAITAHKSQGSEWDSVILCDDKMKRDDKDFRRRWLYTAVTRAKESLIWVQ